MIDGHSESVHSVTWSPDSRFVASAGLGEEVFHWELAAEREMMWYEGGQGPLAWSPDGRHLLTASPDGDVELWEVATGQKRLFEETKLSPSQPNRISAIGWSPDGRYIAAAGSDTTVKVWEVAAMENAEERWDEDEEWDGDTE